MMSLHRCIHHFSNDIGEVRTCDVAATRYSPVLMCRMMLENVNVKKHRDRAMFILLCFMAAASLPLELDTRHFVGTFNQHYISVTNYV